MDLNAILILCLLLFIYIIVKIPTKKKTKKSTGREPLEAEESSKVDYTEMYQKRYLLTIHEKTEYNKIKRVAEKLDLLLFTKVRLADIVEPQPGNKKWQTLFAKIQSKHVDFLLCTNNVQMLCVIEIDDNSHNRQDRQERDKFVDGVLQNVGITIFHIRSIDEAELETEIKGLYYN